MAYEAMTDLNTDDLVDEDEWDKIKANFDYLYGQRVVKIAESVLTGSAASVTFSSIPADYRNLVVEWRGRGDTAAANVTMVAQFNGDTGGNYDWVKGAWPQGSAPAAPGGTAAASYMEICDMAANTAPASVPSSGVIHIQGYKNTTLYKSLVAQGNLKNAAAITGAYVIIASGWWRSTSAITSILFKPLAGNFVAGTEFHLYGEI